MILYFTGTGNSRFAANQLAELLGDEVQSINQYMKEEKTGNFTSSKPYVFVTPTYMSRMPVDVEQFIRSASCSGNKNAYFVFTAGAAIGNAGKYCRKLCEEKNLLYRGTTSVKMPANYVVMYDVLPKSKAKEAAQKAIPEIQKAADVIQSGKMLTEKPDMARHKAFSAIAPVFNSVMVSAKAFQVNDSCTSCGTCKKLCPKNNIQITEGKPVWEKDCMHCMACISACPAAAIDYGKKTAERNRYYLDA